MFEHVTIDQSVSTIASPAISHLIPFSKVFEDIDVQPTPYEFQALRHHHPTWVGRHFTAVDLGRVKRVRVSEAHGGAAGRGRRISGLMFEFWDGCASEILGQWIEEAFSFGLKEGEAIVEIGIYFADGVFADSPLRHMNDITGIKFVSSRGLTHSINFPSAGNVPLIYYRGNPFEKLVGRSLVRIVTLSLRQRVPRTRRCFLRRLPHTDS